MKPRVATLSVALAFALLAVPLPSNGQQPGKVYRIGYLGVSEAPTHQIPQHCPRPEPDDLFWPALVEGLREHGSVEGRNLIIDCRWMERKAERAPAAAAELVSLKPDLIVAYGDPNVRAAKQATTEIPILMLRVSDPVLAGLVASLAHPGGNVTGLTYAVGLQQEGKRLQLLKEAVPTLSRVAVLVHTTGGPPKPTFQFRREEEAAARALGLTLQFYGVRELNELAGVFTAMSRARAEGLFLVPHPFWGDREPQIVALAAQRRLPAVYPWREFVDAGGLIAYYANELPSVRRLGFYVDRILQGTKPGDLPVEQPTKFELLINLKTAKALGLTIPQSLLSRADEVIE